MIEEAMTQPDPVRWGILGAADIARRAFLPALREAGGVAHAVASRDGGRAQSFADANGVERAVEGYDALLADALVEAVYIPLPNALHAEWTVAALCAGKAVLCEKPLAANVAETEMVIATARTTGRPLWEAFVFPFHRQMARLREVIRSGEVGEVREVQGSWHFLLEDRGDIRFSPELAGGALQDVGCYCIRLARLVFDADPVRGIGMARWAPEGVDEELQGVLAFPGERRLTFSCGMDRDNDSFTRVVGTAGEIRMTNPYHPTPDDVFEVRTRDGARAEPAANGEFSFAPAIRHIHGVVRGDEAPRHLAADEALGNAVGIELLLRSAREGRQERV